MRADECTPTWDAKPRKLINRDQFARVRASFEVVNFQFGGNNKIPVSQPQSKYNTKDLQSGNKYSKFPTQFFFEFLYLWEKRSNQCSIFWRITSLPTESGKDSQFSIVQHSCSALSEIARLRKKYPRSGGLVSEIAHILRSYHKVFVLSREGSKEKKSSSIQSDVGRFEDAKLERLKCKFL